MNEITQISPVTDQQLADLVSDEAFAELAEMITAMPVRGKSRRRWSQRRTHNPWFGSRSTSRWRPVLMLGAIAVAAIAGVTALGNAGGHVGPLALGPGSAQALSFQSHGRYIVVLVRQPLADPARYNAEFAAHHLNIELKMIPASPSVVGTVIYIGGSHLDQLKPITANRAKCRVDGNACQIGFRVSTHYHGIARIAFGRAARSGEHYESSGSVTAPGEAMHGMTYKHETVSTVLAKLHARHMTASQYRYLEHLRHSLYSKALRPSQVPASWLVENADPWAPHQVMLWVRPRR